MQSRKISFLPNTTSSMSTILETSRPFYGDPPPSAFSSPRKTSSSYDEGQSNIASKKILLLDDTPSIIKVIGRLLQTNGHMVDTAINGYKGLEKLKQSYLTKDTTITNIDSTNGCQYIGYDLVLSDLQMPVLDGLEFTKRFRAWEEEQQCIREAQGLPRRKRFFIIGMSANCDEQTKQVTVQAGMDHFIGKPFNYVDLEVILECHDLDMKV